ncbi:hypothetical protein GALL_341250 [mine drainage metagenome]|uniref:Uncharacterized protein n=1 Tax=mine drainage metagenome TaxID=410659 RepID=A0A1J5R7B5_9ZZZZ
MAPGQAHVVHPGGREDVQRADDHRRGEHPERGDHGRPHALVRDNHVPDDPGELQADQGERERLEHHVERRPDRPLVQARGVARLRRGVTQVQACRDDGEDPGAAELLGAPVGRERGQQTERGGDDGVVQMHAD